ncbi:MAG: hypothetical protein ABUL72_00690, partial [Armatimonadota bacterium]
MRFNLQGSPFELPKKSKPERSKQRRQRQKNGSFLLEFMVTMDPDLDPHAIQIGEGIDSGFHVCAPSIRKSLENKILPLVSFEGDSLVGQGTAFIVSCWGLMITATHIFDMLERSGKEVIRDGRKLQEYNLYALFRSGEYHNGDPNAEIGGLIPVCKAWASENSDVAFCLLQPMTHANTG